MLCFKCFLNFFIAEKSILYSQNNHIIIIYNTLDAAEKYRFKYVYTYYVYSDYPRVVNCGIVGYDNEDLKHVSITNGFAHVTHTHNIYIIPGFLKLLSP